MRVVGTAGHVDHGKSTLVQALTGINPDRLEEEQRREMTIDLGFAWLTLPGGQVVSLVDVPGHEAFIKNMLAGVGGLDAALLVIAADEGIMPQTREHLAILDLLNVRGGVIAVTKADLAESPAWLELVENEIRTELKGTFLERAAVLPVSARTGQGLDRLKRELERVLQEVSPRQNLGRPRLPVDRVFTIAGFGTVVTGTLGDGSFSVGDEVEILPRAIRARVRGLQRHQAQVERIEPGTRLAMNLGGLAKEDIRRGDTVVRPGTFDPTSLVDVRLEWLPGAPKPVKHNDRLDFFVFAQEIPARVRLLDRELLEPGGSGWAQLVLEQPAVLAKGDRFILRVPSPSQTVGGGQVVNPHPTQRYKRNRPEVLAQIETTARGSPAEIVYQFLAGRTAEGMREIEHGTGLSEQIVETALEELVKAERVLQLGPRTNFLALTGPNWEALTARIGQMLGEYHRQFPLRGGLPREELKSRLGLPARTFDLVLERALEEGVAEGEETLLRRPGFTVRFPAGLQEKIRVLLDQYRRTPFDSPTAQDADAAIGSDALNALVAQKQLVRLGDQVLFDPEALRQVADWVVEYLHYHPQLTAAELRDHFQTSRKYAIALLEYLDEKRVTRRVGDARVLR